MAKKIQRQKTFWGWVWHYCCSIKVALTLLIILALVSIIGTLIAQEPAEKLFQIYQPATAKIILSLGLNNLYGTWWFVTLLALLIVNLACCSWHRFLPTWKLITHPRMKVSPDFMKGRKNHDEFVTTAVNSLDDVVKVVRRSGYQVKMQEDGRFYAAKGRWTRIGFIITHISIIMVLVGAIIGKKYGFKGFMQIREGELTPMYWNRTLNRAAKLDFSLRLSKLYMEYYRPEFYLQVLDQQKNSVLSTPKINLGGTFSLPGTKINGKIVDYRSNYQEPDNIDWMTDSRNILIDPTYPAILINFFDKNSKVEIGERWVFIPGSPLAQEPIIGGIKVVLYNLITDRTKDFKSELEVYEGRQKIFTKTIEVNDPLRYKGITFYQSSFDKDRRVTGLQVAKDPGVPIVYIFCTTMIIGVMFSFGMGSLFVILPLIELIWFLYQFGAASALLGAMGIPAVILGMVLVGVTCFLGFIAPSKMKWSLGGIALVSVLGYLGVYLALGGKLAGWALLAIETNWLLGAMTTLSVLHRQLWFLVSETKKGLEIHMAGLSHRNPLGFRLEYDKILAALSQNKIAD